LIGIAAGLMGALALTRFMRSILFDVSPFDPTTFACGCVLLLAIALAASYFPAQRAALVDPIDALRAE
jgi:ABC-type lipoprotein release transport system permease subunit